MKSLAVLSFMLLACSGPAAMPDAGSDGGLMLDSGARDGGPDGGPACNGPPGLYVAGSCDVLADNVRPFHPRYVLWADASQKDRFVFLPPGSHIDTTNPDRWTFPQGTTFFKTFSLNGVRLETRILQKTGSTPGPTSWTMTAYAWSADQLSVSVVDSGGQQNVLGTQHDIPSQAQCASCHILGNGNTALAGSVDIINGFEAIQLNHDEAGVNLQMLLDQGLLVNLASPTAPDPNVTRAGSEIPVDAADPNPDQTRSALGYLHANCGHCHSTVAHPGEVDEVFFVPTGVTDITMLPIWMTARCNATLGPPPFTVELVPGDPTNSYMVHRMNVRGGYPQMPPIGTEVIDDSGVNLVSAWIASLTAPCP